MQHGIIISQLLSCNESKKLILKNNLSIKRERGMVLCLCGRDGKRARGLGIDPKVSVGRYYWARPPPHSRYSPEQVSVDGPGHPQLS